jgi:hypothetical protein
MMSTAKEDRKWAATPGLAVQINSLRSAAFLASKGLEVPEKIFTNKLSLV